MLKRQKQIPESLKMSRTSTIAVTYDIANTSTKLILLNFSKKDESRFRTKEVTKGANFLPKSLKSCQCLTETAPACACHQRDKSIPPHTRSSTAQHAETSQPKIDLRSQSAKKSEKLNNLDKLPPCSTKNKASGKTSKKSRGLSSHMVDRGRTPHSRDLDVLFSMPSLCHPDFTIGQRRVLLSLARIYMNITPTVRLRDEFSRREFSSRDQTRASKENKEKRSKNSKKSKDKKKSDILRRDSLITAVRHFTDGMDGGSGFGEGEISYADKNDDSNHILDSSSQDLGDWIMNIIQDQAVYISQESRSKDSNGRISEECNEVPNTKEWANDVPEITPKVNEEDQITYTDFPGVVQGEETRNDAFYGEDKEMNEIGDEIVEVKMVIEGEHGNGSDETIRKEISNEDEVMIEREEDDTCVHNEIVEEGKVIGGENGHACEETIRKESYSKNEGMQEGEDFDTYVHNEIAEGQEDLEEESQSHGEVKEIEYINEYLVNDEELVEEKNGAEGCIMSSLDTQRDNPGSIGTSDDITDNFNLLRYISDELRQMMVRK